MDDSCIKLFQLYIEMSALANAEASERALARTFTLLRQSSLATLKMTASQRQRLLNQISHQRGILQSRINGLRTQGRGRKRRTQRGGYTSNPVTRAISAPTNLRHQIHHNDQHLRQLRSDRVLINHAIAPIWGVPRTIPQSLRYAWLNHRLQRNRRAEIAAIERGTQLRRWQAYHGF